ncbi:MAG: nuclear transport factor 2 family protein [Beijerinckiaceae bacterium]|nr:nuclear transport factor 2 family protein [Beijerinckiaceae bacterium]
MTNMEVAQDFAAMLKRGDHIEAGDKYNADDIVSIEAMDGPMAMVKGKAALKGKSDWWYANHEIHSAVSNGPFVNGDSFAMHFAIDVTMKASGQRMQMEEIGIYKIANGKIVEERFYPMVSGQ